MGECARGLVKEANEKRRIACWLGDGAYDSGMVFEELEERGIEAVIKPRRNSVPGPGSSARGGRMLYLFLLNYETV